MNDLNDNDLLTDLNENLQKLEKNLDALQNWDPTLLEGFCAAAALLTGVTLLSLFVKKMLRTQNNPKADGNEIKKNDPKEKNKPSEQYVAYAAEIEKAEKLHEVNIQTNIGDLQKPYFVEDDKLIEENYSTDNIVYNNLETTPTLKVTTRTFASYMTIPSLSIFKTNNTPQIDQNVQDDSSLATKENKEKKLAYEVKIKEKKLAEFDIQTNLSIKDDSKNTEVKFSAWDNLVPSIDTEKLMNYFYKKPESKNNDSDESKNIDNKPESKNNDSDESKNIDNKSINNDLVDSSEKLLLAKSKWKFDPQIAQDILQMNNKPPAKLHRKDSKIIIEEIDPKTNVDLINYNNNENVEKKI